MPGKKFAQPLRQRKKIRASESKVQIVLKKILAEVKQFCREMRLKKKSCRKNFIPPPPGISNGPPLTNLYISSVK